MKNTANAALSLSAIAMAMQAHASASDCATSPRLLAPTVGTVFTYDLGNGSTATQTIIASGNGVTVHMERYKSSDGEWSSSPGNFSTIQGFLQVATIAPGPKGWAKTKVFNDDASVKLSGLLVNESVLLEETETLKDNNGNKKQSAKGSTKVTFLGCVNAHTNGIPDRLLNYKVISQSMIPERRQGRWGVRKIHETVQVSENLGWVVSVDDGEGSYNLVESK